jgi:hypothetical protein
MHRTVILFVGSLLVALAVVIVGTAPAYPNPWRWLQDWQTLIAGLIALGAALATIEWMQKGIDETVRQARENRQRDLDAARTVLPLALSGICGYAETCGVILKGMLEESAHLSDEVNVPPEFTSPELPDQAIGIVRDCVRPAEADIACQLRQLISDFQVQNVRLRAIPDDSRAGRLSKHNVHQYVLDTAELYARASALFDFARDPDETPLTREQMRHGLNLTGFWRGECEEVDAIFERRWPPIP